jgi:hypothetical protein
LRPILMTSFALISGMIPVAIGLNEVSNQRTSLGVAVIGGVVSSTLLTLIVIPSVFAYMEAVRHFLLRFGNKIVTPDLHPAKNGKYNRPDSFVGNLDDSPRRNKTL